MTLDRKVVLLELLMRDLFDDALNRAFDSSNSALNHAAIILAELDADAEESKR